MDAPDAPARSPRVLRWATDWVRRWATWPHLVIAVVASYVAVVNVGPGTTVHFIDNLWPLDPRGFLGTLQYAWLPQRLGFYNVLSLQALPYTAWAAGLQTVGLSSSAQEIATVAGLQALTGIYGFRLFQTHLLREVALPRRTLFSLLAALAIMNNFAVQSVYWWDFLPDGFVLTAFGVAFLCYSLDAFAEYHRSGRLPRWPVVGMLLTSTIAFSVSIPFNLAILALAALLPPFVLLTSPPVARGLRRLGTFLVFEGGAILATSLWWVVPSYMMTQLQPSYIGSSAITSQSLQTFQSGTSSVTFLTVLGGSFGYPYSATGHLAITTAITDNVGVAFQVVLPLGIFAALLLRPRPSSPALPYLVAAALALALLITGTNSPLAPGFFTALFTSSVALTALRTPFVALGYGFELLWVAAAALAADRYLRWWRAVRSSRAAEPEPASDFSPAVRRGGTRGDRIGWPLTATVAVLLILVPVAAAAPAAYDGDAVPVAPYLAHLSVPAYEFEVADYLESHLDNRYALLFPGGFLDQNWTDGYDAYDILPSILPGSLLIDNYRTGFVAADDPLLDQAYLDLTEASTNTTAFAALLSQLAVGYIVVEGELNESPYFGTAYAPDYPVLLAALNRTSDLSLAAVIGPDYLYFVDTAPILVSSVDAAIPATSLLAGTIDPEVNLTAVFRNGTMVSGSEAPLHTFAPISGTGPIRFALSSGDLANLSRSPFPAPLGPSGPPVVFNGLPLDLNTTIFPYLVLNFTTNPGTAISVAVVTVPDLETVNATVLAAHTFYVAAPYDNLGSGDAALVPSYGANHFTSPGTATTLVADLAGLLGGSADRTVDYLLISLWPVVDGSGVARGTPTVDWPTPLSLTIDDVTLGANVYDPPEFGATETPLADLGRVEVENVTGAYWAGLLGTSASAPTRTLFPTEDGAATLSANSSVKSNWTEYQVGAPFPAGGPPTFLNGAPLDWDRLSLPFLSVSLRTLEGTAFDAAVLGISNLSGISPTELESATQYLGGSASNLGPGDPALVPAYGGLHFTTNGSWYDVEDDLAAPGSTGAGSPVQYLIFQLAYVAPNGTASRGLPVDAWPGDQSLQLGGVTLGNVALAPGAPVANGSWIGTAGLTNVTAPPPLPASTAVVPESVGPLDPASVSDVVQVSPTEVTATVGFGPDASEPSLIVLHETYSAGWVVVPGPGIRSVQHVAVDGAQNGYLVTPTAPNSTITLELEFAPQTAFELALWGGLAVPVVASALVLALASWRRVRFLA